MRYKIGRNPVYRAPIPALIGGINTAASSDIVGDNQLSNCLNMMAMDGILRTRPGFVVDESGIGIQDLQSNAKNITKYDFTVEQDGVYGKMISVWGNDGIISFFHCRKDGSLVDAGSIDTKGDIINEFTVTGNDGLYCFVTADVTEEGETEPTRKYDIYTNKKSESEYTDTEAGDVVETEDRGWYEVAEPYAPTVMTNCVTDGDVTSGVLGGDYLVGFNLLSSKYKIEVTAFNERLMEYYHSAVYKLKHKIPIGTDVFISIVKKDGNIDERKVTINEGTYSFENTENSNGDETSRLEENTETSDEEITSSPVYFIAVKNQQTIIFYKELDENGDPIIARVIDDMSRIDFMVDMMYDSEFEVPDDTKVEDLAEAIKKAREDMKTVEKEKCIELPGYNNLTITAEYEPDEEAKKRIFSATCAAWYGGNQGLASGTRLFIGGMEGIYKNVLQWTDLSNPLYFPENCNAEVGDPSQGITAFGKQADMLVVFKPFEIYGASYLLQDAPVEDAAYDFISDLTVTTAVFPLTQISNEIGCDCPGTIQLCRNRLCWVHSNGKAYTLVSSSQYNEKNIYELSDPVRRAIPNIPSERLKKATSTDWEGYYVLSAGEHIFLMQYESYGYSRIYSYTSEEAASHKLPWFYLKTPFVPAAVMNIDNQLITVSSPDTGTIILHRADKDSVKDDIVSVDGGTVAVSQSQIPSMVQSKVFDFSRPEIKKVICHILAEVGGTSGNSIKLSAVTDRSRYEDTVEGDGNSPINLDDEFTLEGSSIFTPLPETIERTVMRINGSEATPVDIKRINSSAPGFFRMIRVNPGIFGVRKFAVRLESEGAFSLGQVCVEYKMLGSVN